MKQKYQLQTLTPVHIGSGETLSHIDGCYANGRWYRIDLDKVLAHPSTDLNALTSEMAQRNFRWERYLRQSGSDLSELSAYSLLCPQSPEEVEIREAIKTVHNQPYIPGSTLKGAIRTALLWDLINASQKHYDNTLNGLEELADQEPRRSSRRETPAKPIEQQIFGRDPNRDILRALQVSDTTTMDLSGLEIGTAWTVTLNSSTQLEQKIDRNQEYKIFTEQIQPRQQLTFSLKIDEWLLKAPATKQLDFTPSQGDAIRDIAAVCHWVTGDLIQREQKFFSTYNFPEIANIYDRLLRLNERLTGGGSFLLQIGWGTGYDSKTITPLFTYDENDPEAAQELLMDLRERFKLGESRSQRENYDDREFPKTRRVLYRGQNPIAPLGWVKISPIED